MACGYNPNHTLTFYFLILFIVTFVIILIILLLAKPNFVCYTDSNGNLQYDYSLVLLYAFLLTILVIILYAVYSLIILGIVNC